MGLRKRLRKIIPREIRNNPLVAVVAVVALGPVALGAIGASTASIVGATVSATSATAVALGTAVVTTGVTFAQTGDVSDSLKAGVRAGVGSAVGSAVSSSVTNAVAGQTGASIADLEPALRELPSQAGIGGSLAGAASITAGNVAGEAARAAVTGRPIEEGALLGLTASIPQALAVAPEFNSLHPIVQNVVASSAQAAVRGQDVGDAALTALITSSKIVSRAINELPNGQEIIRQNPTFTKYVIDSVSSALAAQLQGKDVSESVIQRLVQTTAEVIGQEIENAEKSGKLQEAQSTYSQAEEAQAQINLYNEYLTGLYARNEGTIQSYNNVVQQAQAAADANKRSIHTAQSYLDMINDPFIDAYYSDPQQHRASLQSWVTHYTNVANTEYAAYQSLQRELKFYDDQLAMNGFYTELEVLNEKKQFFENQFQNLTTKLQTQSKELADASANLFTDFETELATTIAPLTAFEDVTDVGDQDVLAEIQPVAPPTELVQAPPTAAPTEVAQAELPLDAPVTEQEIAQEVQGGGQLPTDIGVEVAGDVNRDAIRGTFVVPFAGENYSIPDKRTTINPQQGQTWQPYEVINRYVSGTKSDGTPYSYMITLSPETGVSYTNVQNAEDIVTSRQASYDAFAQYDKDQPDQGTNVAPEGWGLTGIGEDAGAGVVTEAPTGVGTDAGIGTGTPSAPPIDYSLAATEMQGTPLGEQPPFPTIGLNLLTAGTGIEGGRNRALFNTGGGFGSGGNTTETTWSLVARASETGTNDIVDVGGKLYSLILLPDKQVLVPEEPSEVVVYIERDLTTDLPRMREVPTSSVPPQEAQQIAEKVGQTAGGAPAGAEGAAGGRTAEEERVATTEEQLQPGARPEEVAAAPSFPELISGETEPTMPAPVPGEDAGFEEAIRAPGAGGVEGEITDEDIIRLIENEIGIPGGGEGEGAPGEEGAGVGEGEEGVGPGAGEEGEGEGIAGEGEGTGEGVGPGTGEGGGEVTPSPDILLPTARVTTVGRRTFQRPGEAAPYRVTGMDESGILGRKQPLFGGDEDLQRAEWNRRSLRLKRLLGL